MADQDGQDVSREASKTYLQIKLLLRRNREGPRQESNLRTRFRKPRCRLRRRARDRLHRLFSETTLKTPEERCETLRRVTISSQIRPTSDHPHEGRATTRNDRRSRPRRPCDVWGVQTHEFSASCPGLSKDDVEPSGEQLRQRTLRRSLCVYGSASPPHVELDVPAELGPEMARSRTSSEIRSSRGFHGR